MLLEHSKITKKEPKKWTKRQFTKIHHDVLDISLDIHNHVVDIDLKFPRC